MNELIKYIKFKNSPEWIKYSHERYLPPEDIMYRLKIEKNSEKWNELVSTIMATRTLQALPLFLKSIEKDFWYFEADCIQKKLSEVVRLGTEVYDKIHGDRTFEKEFILNAAIEEAVTSAIYEGANTTRAQAKQVIAEGRRPKNKDEYMYVNNLRAQQWIKNNIQTPIDLDLILKVHSIVTQNTLEGDLVDCSGKFRDDVVYVGKHTGIDYKLIKLSLKESIFLCLENARFIHPLIQGILLHYFIAYIHPFFDGNGRTARTLFYFNGIKHNLKFLELLSISADLKRHGKRYERAFDNAVKYKGDVTYFVDFSLDSLLEAVKVVEGKVKHLQNIWKVKDMFDLSDNQIMLLQKLALHKFRLITINEYAQDINKSHELARIELKHLARQNLLNERTMGKKLVFQVNSKYLKKVVSEEIAG